MKFLFRRKDGSDDVHDTHEKRYLPEPLRHRAVEYLRAELHPNTLSEVRAAHAKDPDEWWTGFHMFGGMAIRNLLRDVITDQQLPAVMYDDRPMHNWDDYYIEVLEEAAGCYDD